jgi:hypothetical protein
VGRGLGRETTPADLDRQQLSPPRHNRPRRSGDIHERWYSEGFFSAGVAAVVLVLLGGTTWASDGVWAPDGAYALIAQIVLFAWIAVLSGFLAMRSPSTARAPERAAVPAP